MSNKHKPSPVAEIREKDKFTFDIKMFSLKTNASRCEGICEVDELELRICYSVTKFVQIFWKQRLVNFIFSR